ncbi:hypothetical protein G7046_g7419 [Stylonectria norvegica]|nr:hypothetical protein G7046_g7419 [Stylonectria norvegica]
MLQKDLIKMFIVHPVVVFWTITVTESSIAILCLGREQGCPRGMAYNPQDTYGLTRHLLYYANTVRQFECRINVPSVVSRWIALITLGILEVPDFTRVGFAASFEPSKHIHSRFSVSNHSEKDGKSAYSTIRLSSNWSCIPYQVNGRLSLTLALGAEKVPPSYISARCSISVSVELDEKEFEDWVASGRHQNTDSVMGGEWIDFHFDLILQQFKGLAASRRTHHTYHSPCDEPYRKLSATRYAVGAASGTMPLPRPFHIRDAGASPHDAEFIIEAFDSTLPHLTAAGNAGQWGTAPFSKKPGFCQSTRDDILQSERFRDSGTGERLRVFIAEIEEEALLDAAGGAYDRRDGLARRVDELGGTYVSAGAATLRDEDFARHILMSKDLRTHVDSAKSAGGFVFLDVIVTDHRLGNRRRGAGLALIDHIKQYALDHEKKTIWLDCWLGETQRLAQYYQDMGFKPVQDFELQRKDRSAWQGRLFRMALA